MPEPKLLLPAPVSSVFQRAYRNANDNLTSITNGGQASRLSWAYDAYDRVRWYRDSDGNLLQYRYDAAGNLTNLVYPGGRNVYYAYDSLNRLTNVTDWAKRKTSFEYDLAGRVRKIIRPNGTVREMDYDAAGRIRWEFGAPLPKPYTPPQLAMTYDDDNRLLSVNGQGVSYDLDGNMTNGPLPGGLNFYAYADGNPVSYLDPFGLCGASEGVWSWLGGVGTGFAGAGWDTVAGLWSAVTDPGRTVSGLWNAVTHPGQTVDAITIGLAEYADRVLSGDPEAIGRATFELVAMALPASKVRYLDVAGDVGRAAGKGTQGLVIIGETMARVEAAAAKYPGAKILNDMPDFRAMGMTDYEVTGAMMRYNRQWILEQMRSGRKIIDIGPDPNRPVPSIFYQMEQNMLKNYQKLHPEFNSVLRP